MADDVLYGDLTLEYPFVRSTGPVVGAFLTGLRDGVILGVKRADGSVMVPPLEYDPATAEPLTELVEVADVGVVTSWCWNGEPRPRQHFDGPFAWALVTLDGATTPMLHGVLAPADALSVGMRVRAKWRDQRVGQIDDIECFVPEADTSGEGR